MCSLTQAREFLREHILNTEHDLSEIKSNWLAAPAEHKAPVCQELYDSAVLTVEKKLKFFNKLLEVSDPKTPQYLVDAAIQYDQRITQLYSHRKYSYSQQIKLKYEYERYIDDQHNASGHVIDIKMKICAIEINMQSLDIHLHEAWLIDQLANTSHFRQNLILVLRQKIQYLPYLNRLREILKLQKQLQNCKHKSRIIPEAPALVARLESQLLLYKIQALFLNCYLNKRLGLEDFPNDLKYRLSNLIKNYKIFHEQEYLNNSKPPLEFIIPEDLLSEISFFNCRFERANIPQFASIISTVKTVSNKLRPNLKT